MGTINQASIQSYFRKAFDVLMHPRVDLYQAEARNANWNGVMIGVGAVTILAFIAAIINGLLSGALENSFGSSSGLMLGGAGGIATAFIYLIFVPLFFFAGAGVLWLSAKIFGGRGENFMVHSYLLSLSYTPTRLIVFGLLIISIGPVALIASLVQFVLYLYQIYHAGLSLQVSQGMESGRAQMAAWVPALILLALACACGVIAALTGAAIFSSFLANQ